MKHFCHVVRHCENVVAAGQLTHFPPDLSIDVFPSRVIVRFILAKIYCIVLGAQDVLLDGRGGCGGVGDGQRCTRAARSPRICVWYRSFCAEFLRGNSFDFLLAMHILTVHVVLPWEEGAAARVSLGLHLAAVVIVGDMGVSHRDVNLNDQNERWSRGLQQPGGVPARGLPQPGWPEWPRRRFGRTSLFSIMTMCNSQRKTSLKEFTRN